MLKEKEYDMNKKTLILLAMAATLAIPTGANATSTITGVANGTSGTFTISPEFVGKANGEGFRKYTNFTLGAGDTANLNFQGEQNGKTVDISTFVNLVQNKVNINGVLNTVKDGAFNNGHAVFITPGGMVVGASGVLNVGRLSVVTPTATKFNEIGTAYDAYNADKTDENATAFVNTGVLNFLSNTKKGGSWGSNAAIDVQGKVLARDGVVLRGTQVGVSGAVVNGIPKTSTYNQLYTDSMNTLFNSLVNISGIKGLDAGSGSSQIVVEAENGLTSTGKILNNDKGGTYLTNRGANGLTVDGEVYARGTATTDKIGSQGQNGTGAVRLYSTAGDVKVGTSATTALEGDRVQVLNNGGGALTIGSNATINGGATQIYNAGTGALTTNATIDTDTLSLKNKKGTGMNVGGTITGNGDVAIKNYAGAMNYTADLTNNNNNTGIVNYTGAYTTSSGASETATGTTMAVGGKVTNNGSTGIINIKNAGSGAMTVTGDITNKATSGVITGKKTNTTTYITNRGSGLNYSGTANVSGGGDLAINNYKGAMDVKGTVNVTNGNLGIVDRNGAGAMNVASNITVEGGNASLKKEANTTGDMTVDGTITHNGYMAVLNNAGDLNLGATVTNNGGAVKDSSGNLAGGFYAITRSTGDGVNVKSTFNGTGSGEYLITNKGKSGGFTYTDGAVINTTNRASLVNRDGAFNVAGDITANQIIVRSGTKADPSASTFTVSGTLTPTVKTVDGGTAIVNWYEGGSANAVNADPQNGKKYGDVEIRQQEIK